MVYVHSQVLVDVLLCQIATFTELMAQIWLMARITQSEKTLLVFIYLTFMRDLVAPRCVLHNRTILGVVRLLAEMTQRRVLALPRRLSKVLSVTRVLLRPLQRVISFLLAVKVVILDVLALGIVLEVDIIVFDYTVGMAAYLVEFVVFGGNSIIQG